MRVYHKLSGNGQGYTVVFWDSCRKFDPADIENVNWHTFDIGDVLYGFSSEPIGTVVKVTGNKILFV